MIATGHLITGLLKTLLECCFEEIKYRTLARLLDLELQRALERVGTEGQNELYKCQMRTLCSISICSRYCLLLVLSTVFRSTGLSDEQKGSSRITLLKCVLCLLFKWLGKSTDGVDEVPSIPGPIPGWSQHLYPRFLLYLVQKYVQSVIKLCVLHPSLKSHLHKPNVHRL